MNDFWKVTDLTIELWAKVLNRVADSSLLLIAPSGAARKRIAATFRSHDVEDGRIRFIDASEGRKRLDQFDKIDIYLDTVPCGGITEHLDATFMGTPVVTMAGELPVWRIGASILNQLELPELIADRNAEYVSIANDLAGNHQRLRELKHSLRDRLLKSPMADARSFARDIESAFRSAWAAWAASVAPQVGIAK